MTRQGPLRAADLSLALIAVSRMNQQYIELLDLVSQLAGPSLTPMGSPPAAPAAIVTCNITHNSLLSENVGVDPSLSTQAMASQRVPIPALPSIWLDRAISNPVTILTTGSLPAFSPNGVTLASDTYANSTSRFANVMNARMEIRSGGGTVRVITTWGSFVVNVATPLLNTYQSQIQLLTNRIRATTLPAGQASVIWTTLSGITPESTQLMLDQLRVLRDPSGNPIYIPPAQYHDNRDILIGAVVAENLSFADAAEFI